MELRNVLVIAYYFPPMGLSGVQRTVKFAKYLPEFGWNPVILTCTPHKYYAYDYAMLDEIEAAGMEIYRTPHKKVTDIRALKTKKFPSYLTQKVGRLVSQSLRQPDSKAAWKKEALRLGEEIIKERKIEVIFATAPPFTDFLVAKELSEKFNIPFVSDYRDSWVDNPYNFYLTPFHKSLGINMEGDVLLKSAKTVVISRYAKELILKRYKFIRHEDIEIIPHGYDKEDFERAPVPVKEREKFVICHSGLFQDNRTPRYFLAAMGRLFKENPEIKSSVKLVLVGLMRRSHMKLIKKYRLENNVEVTGNVEHSVAVGHLKSADLLWLMLDDGIRTPGKLYEYFGSGKPMLVTAPESGVTQLAAESKAAIITESRSVEKIKIAIFTYFQMWKKGIMPVQEKEFTDKFDRKNLTERLARVLSHSSIF